MKLAAPVGILGAIRRSLWTYALMKMRFFLMESGCDEKMRESYPQIWVMNTVIMNIYLLGNVIALGHLDA